MSNAQFRLSFIFCVIFSKKYVFFLYIGLAYSSRTHVMLSDNMARDWHTKLHETLFLKYDCYAKLKAVGFKFFT